MNLKDPVAPRETEERFKTLQRSLLKHIDMKELTTKTRRAQRNDQL
jgi:hypothetical protein